MVAFLAHDEGEGRAPLGVDRPERALELRHLLVHDRRELALRDAVLRAQQERGISKLCKVKGRGRGRPSAEEEKDEEEEDARGRR